MFPSRLRNSPLHCHARTTEILLACLCWEISKVSPALGRPTLHCCGSMSTNTAGMVELARALNFRVPVKVDVGGCGISQGMYSYITTKVVLPAESDESMTLDSLFQLSLPVLEAKSCKPEGSRCSSIYSRSKLHKRTVTTPEKAQYSQK